MKCQFGSTLGVGCQYGKFTIKSLLHLRHNHKLTTWVAFKDLVKYFETPNHTLLISILGKYCIPPRLRSEIKRMYDKSIVKLIIGKMETPIDFKVGVKKGESMAPVLFLFLMINFFETLEDKWTDLGLSKFQFARKDKSPRSTGQVVIHRPGTFLSGILFDLFGMPYVDNGAFVFESRTDCWNMSWNVIEREIY